MIESESVKNSKLEKEREGFVRYLHDMNYSKRSLNQYRLTIKRLEQYMSEHKLSQYNRSVGEAFLKHMAEESEYAVGAAKEAVYMIRRFNCFLEQGEYTVIPSKISRETPSGFAEGFEKYIDNLKLIGQSKSSIERKHSVIQRVLIDWNKSGTKSYSDIIPKAIYDVFGKSTDKPGFCGSMRDFLRFLFNSGYVPCDYSGIIPSVRKPQCIPSVYTRDETSKLLNVIDTTTKSGKRNMAIILLALKLGMRSCDIVNLKTSNIDFESKTINFIQVKTKIPQRLELLPEIEKSILLYMTTARPVAPCENIFLTMKAPFRPITRSTIYAFAGRYLIKSGVNIGERKHGPHALRMTFASELAAEKIPYDAIRKILGHEDPNVIKHYVKFDIDSLRPCAIEIPPITGKLAEYMQVRRGGALA